MSKSRLADAVARCIRKEILSGQIHSGVHFNEALYASKYEVSRSPLREAIRILEQEGLLETLTTGRTIVAKWTSADLADLYEMRFELESKAITSLLRKPPSFETFAILRQLLRDMEEHLDERAAFHQSDLAFHQTIVTASNNRTLFRLWNTMTPAVMTLQEISNDEVSRERLLGVVADHQRIVDAIRNNDGRAAKSTLRQHMRSGFELIAQVLERNFVHPQHAQPTDET